MDCSTTVSPNEIDQSLFINEQLTELGLYGGAKRELHDGQQSSWRISPDPFWIDQQTFNTLDKLGQDLYQFYQGAQRLYELSLRGRQPKWIQDYLEINKPELVLEWGKMRRLRKDFPLIIRPDILLTDDGIKASELDSVPGGFGLLGALSSIYGKLGYSLIGGNDGIVTAFTHALAATTKQKSPVVAIVVSEESTDYLGEMHWIGEALTSSGLKAYTIRPEELVFQEDGLFVSDNKQLVKIDIIYRFFELFDLRHIPKIDLILYAVRKQQVVITPPVKSFLEEKLLFALLHHETLGDFWQDQLGAERYHKLKEIMPQTWMMDNRPLPPHGIIPGLTVGGHPINSWEQLKGASKQDRELVVKVSGFSKNAWGSRGVSVGHDMSGQDWAEIVDQAQISFDHSPYILQRFHKGSKLERKYYNFHTEKVETMKGRVRLCPYYFVTNDTVQLAGILATVCPLNKKLIHGMVDAVMAPTAIR